MQDFQGKMLDLVPFDRAVSRLYAGEPPDTRRRARLVSSFGLLGVVGGLTLALSHLAWYRIPPMQVVAPAVAGLASLAVPAAVLRWRALALAGHLCAACWLVATSRLGQVLVNLLVNAAQAEARSVWVRTGTTARGDAELVVRDTGQGIPPEVLARVTEPFFTTKPRGMGTGLGLAVCDKLVRELGGSMAIESAVGVGTTVTLVLPRQGVAAVPAVAADADPG